MTITIPDAVRQMLGIVEKLCAAYPKKRFTLDGRLVGDIGEVLVEDGVQIHSDGSFSEMFNGPGAVAWETVKGREAPKTNLFSVPITSLQKLQAQVAESDKVEDAVKIFKDRSWGSRAVLNHEGRNVGRRVGGRRTGILGERPHARVRHPHGGRLD